MKKEQSQELSSETLTCLEVRKQEEVLGKELEMEQPKARKSQKDCGVKDKGPLITIQSLIMGFYKKDAFEKRSHLRRMVGTKIK